VVDEAARLDFSPIRVEPVAATEQADDELALDALREECFGIAGDARHAQDSS
jgi:hypothetical protein